MKKLKVLTQQQHIDISNEITDYLKNKYPDLVTVTYTDFNGGASDGHYMVAATESVAKKVEHVWRNPSLFVGRLNWGGLDYGGTKSFAKKVFDTEAMESGIQKFGEYEIEETQTAKT